MAPKFTRLCAVLALGLTLGLTVNAKSAPESPRTKPATLYTQAQLSSTFDSCKGLFPAGTSISLQAVDSKWLARGLCSNGFASLYSGLSKTPLLVVERLTRETVQDAGDEERTDMFFADPRLPAAERASLKDYVGSGFDRGHLSPAADQVDPTAMAQSFALSNMVPQAPKNNRKTWKKLESDVRKYVLRAQGAVYVFSGPLFLGEVRKLGTGNVWIPSHLFKLVYDETTGKSWAHIVSNTDEARLSAPMTYSEFKKATGWNLLPN